MKSHETRITLLLVLMGSPFYLQVTSPMTVNDLIMLLLVLHFDAVLAILDFSFSSFLGLKPSSKL